MLFNSLEFLVFLPVVFILYWFLFSRSLKAQNILLLLASYLFYGWWDWRFLSLIILSTVVDYFAGLKIHNNEHRPIQRRWLWLSILFNLGMLGFFKYFNFFTQSWIDAFASLGYQMDPLTIQIILPVGISFYTFQTMSYSLDIYKGRLEPTRDFIGFAAFVSFFPQLVAGPIERASNLLPQILNKRRFGLNSAIGGIELILWGFFKKVAIADSMASIVNQVYSAPDAFNSFSLALATLAFSFQIYCDFSGYSDIAIGTARLFGIKLMLNFNYPYLSRNIGEFWRRWHISLSTWFRDYLYIPLGGSRTGRWLNLRNIFIIFVVSGFWHGANWTFIVWGAIHALLFIPLFLAGSNRKYTQDLISASQWLPKFTDLLKVGVTFVLVTLSWVFFRASSVTEAVSILSGMLENRSGNSIVFANTDILNYLMAFGLFFLFSFIFLYRNHGIFPVSVKQHFAFSSLLLVAITLFGQFSKQSFIYFQF